MRRANANRLLLLREASLLLAMTLCAGATPAQLIFVLRVQLSSNCLINDDAILSETLNRLCMSGSVSKRSDQIRNPSALRPLKDPLNHIVPWFF